MTTQDRLDKVINSLEFCLRHPKVYDCDGCQYGGSGTVICEALINDAIILLRTLSPNGLENGNEFLPV